MPSAVTVELWYAALGTPHGVVVETSDPLRTKMKLYSLRKEANDSQLYLLSIIASPTKPESELWIVKRAKDETQS